MKNKKVIIVLFILLSAFGCKQKRVDIFLIGDSTAAEYKEFDRPLNGCGQKLNLFFNENVVIHNFAVSGSSTKRFRDNLMWKKVYECLHGGSYLFIQFGHNDEKMDSTRHAAAGGAYNDNLKRYIIEARSKGAIPILLTPISRRKFDNEGHIINTHGEYPAEMKQVALEMNVPLIDLTDLTKTLIESYGVEESKILFRWVEPGEYPAYPDGMKDNTHLTSLGAEEVSKLVAEEIKKIDIGLKSYIK